LAAQCKALVICGREETGFDCLPDRPERGLGPLGGLNAALHHAKAHGFDAVLSAGCDIPNLPTDLAKVLAGEGAAIVQDQPVVGLWPVALAAELDAYLAEGGRSLYRFAERVNARQLTINPPLMNINRPEDLSG
jgi:molybdopterin-guanine dinucleotide biosynthesis protein A